MKKIIILIITIFLIFNFVGLSSAFIANIHKDLSSSIKEEIAVYPINFPDLKYIHIKNEMKGQKIEFMDFGYLMDPGKPMLPVKNYLFALPPNTKVSSVIFKEGNSTIMKGIYNILPVEPIILLDEHNVNEKEKQINKWEINYQSTYSSFKPYPEKSGKITGFGTLRKYSYVSISVCPFKYYPLSNQLYYSDNIDIIVKYITEENPQYESFIQDTVADEKAKKLFYNYEDIKNLYKPINKSLNTKKNTYDYVIITNDELKNAVSDSNFINWKSSLGYNIKFVTITDSEIFDQSGIDLAEQIRNFLREYYIPWSIKYVLIIGDYVTIPMRYCSPNPNWLAGTVPTDTYYADLSYPDNESWNSNNDDFYGVYGQDNPDFIPEIYVGRIPTSEISRIVYTLDKIKLFEQDMGLWKKNALMGGAMLFYANEDYDEEISFDIDGASLAYHIENDLMNGWKTSLYSEYEGISPSKYLFKPLTEQAFTEDWRSEKYAIVNWAAHGAPASIGRVIWDWDDGDGIPESDTGELTWGSFLNTYSNLEGDYPSIVFAVSCNVGYPEPNADGNLGIDLLTKESFGAAVAVCSSTRGAAVSADWVTSHSGAEALCYEFNNYMINKTNGQTIGEALYDSKSYVHYNFGWDHEYEFMNMYDYNLYGDPSMQREGINSSAPSAPQIIGPNSGKSNELYNYTFVSIDPTDDNLYYYIDWGDGEFEEWIGPFNNNEQIIISHLWNKVGSYIIRAKAKDDNNEESGWNSLEISMPRSQQQYYLNRGEFNAKIGFSGKDESYANLVGIYRNRGRMKILNGILNNAGRESRYQGLFRGNFFILHVSINDMFVNIAGQVRTNSNTKEFNGIWKTRNSRINGWINGNFD